MAQRRERGSSGDHPVLRETESQRGSGVQAGDHPVLRETEAQRGERSSGFRRGAAPGSGPRMG